MAYDGPEVFRAPYANEAALTNFRNTVLDGVAPETVEQFTDHPPVSEGRVRLWGTKPSLDSTWSSIEPGDYLIFYRDGRYTHAAKVANTERNEPLAREVWPNFDSDPWDRIIYLDVPSEIQVSSQEIHDLAGYERAHTQGFSPLNEMGIGGIRGKYGSVEAFAEPDTTTAVDDVDVQTVPEFSVTRHHDRVLDGLYFPDDDGVELLQQVESAIQEGKHVIFTGPPGTGKTELARRLCGLLVDEYSDTYTGYELTTGTSDWSTFETIGGYMPGEAEGDELTFETGQVLRRFKQDGKQCNELLVIDEINRADIDKAFGQLFTLLSGQDVQLPYRKDGEEIIIRHGANADGPPAPHEYVAPESWRLFATMNTYDKTSLYELSYAFMRRFAFVAVDSPTVPDQSVDRIALVEQYLDAWELQVEEQTDIEAVADVWYALNAPGSEHKIGPAIVRDMIRSIECYPGKNRRRAVTAAVGNYVLPQLEGLPRRERILNRIASVDAVNKNQLAAMGADLLNVDINA